MLVGIKGLYTVTSQNSISTFLEKIKKRGVDSVEFDYFKLLAYHTYCTDTITNTVTKLDQFVREGDSIIAHSFGCLLVYDLLRHYKKCHKDRQLKNIYFINPAIDVNIKIPTSNITQLFLFHDKEDRLLRMSRFLPFNRMGALGKYGYQHEDSKIKNIEIDPIEADAWKHQRFFREPNLKKHLEFITAQEN